MEVQGDTAIIEFPLVAPAAAAAAEAAGEPTIIDRLLVLAARGVLMLRRAVAWLGREEPPRETP